MCGSEATTCEHIFKKSVLKTFFGRGPYENDRALVHVKGGNLRSLHGPNASRTKYGQMLCSDCNNDRSKPFDNAFDEFVRYVRLEGERIQSQHLIDFGKIYGPQWPEMQTDLFKYLVKSLGCRIVDANLSVPLDLIHLFDSPLFTTALKITFAINEDMALLPDCDLGLYKGHLFGRHLRVTWPDIPQFWWYENIGWLTISYWYNCVGDSSGGSIWIADAQQVRLGRYAPLTPEMRADVLEKVDTRIDHLANG